MGRKKKLLAVVFCEKQQSKKIVEKNKSPDFGIYSGPAIIPIASMAHCSEMSTSEFGTWVASDIEQVAKTAVSATANQLCAVE